MVKVSPTATAGAAVLRASMALEPKNKSAISKAVKVIGKSMKAQKLAAEEKYRSGIILLSHIPYGFFEDELKGFFSQFGKVKRIRLARSPKTGRAKGYAFIEFEFYEVAQIAAESMNNYLMYERVVKCKLLEPNVNTKKIFAARNIRKNSFPTLFRRNKLIRELTEPMQEKEIEKSLGTKIKCIDRNNNKLAALGINYKYEEVDKDELKKATEFHPDEKSVIITASKKKQKTRATPFITPPPIIQKSIRKKKNKTRASRMSKLNISPKNLKKDKERSQTPEAIKITPKVKATSPSPLPLKLTPLFYIKKDVEEVASEGSSKKEVKKALKFSPKLLRSKTRQSELFTPTAKTIPVPKKTRKSIASVKELRHVETIATSVVTETETKKTVVKKRKSEANVETPKFSPKFLRSKVQSNQSVTPATNPISSASKKARKLIDTVEELHDEEHTSPVGISKKRTSEKQKTKTPEKPKFSPNFLRSKVQSNQSVTPATNPISSASKKARKLIGTVEELRDEEHTSPVGISKKRTSEKQKSKTPEKPKFSPKILRSRARQ